jgi:hypothetical protein
MKRSVLERKNTVLCISVMPQNIWLLISFSVVTIIPHPDMFSAVREMTVRPFILARGKKCCV